ncbi:stable maintenance of chromosomes protein [Cryptosporidium ryanae]|uniref:stable maintenance of chromosomes protein n=1 Tax=Cryptosporidium ryanae TaxID=515981 RepID=UPI00351A14C3|nr:stable maintenance of chromosomes protein [Cryptosporidium ryanae]
MGKVENVNSNLPSGGESGKPRLMIHKIELENFKSYGGKKTIGPFHKSFTSIVGPNGSGKSNVIDAMLFVFGKKAKHMRLNKVSELIHNSKLYPNNEKASVSVHFKEITDIPDKVNEYYTVPNSEIIIKREVLAGSDQTKYYINNKVSSYMEVTKLLTSKGTDLEHNRFLILQGEVESIAQMKPKATNSNEDGLLEYIEDIIGTSSYVPEIKKYSEELEQLNELRQEKLNRLKISENELNCLKGPYNVAIEFFTLEKELYFSRLLFHMEEQKLTMSQVNVLKEELVGLTNTKENLATKKKELEREKSELEKENKDVGFKVKSLKRELEQNENEFKKIVLRDEELRAILKNSKKRLAKQEDSFGSEKRLIPELENKIVKLEDEVRGKQKLVPKVSKDLEEAQEKLEELQKSLKDSIEETRKKKDLAERELVPLQKKLLEFQRSHDMLSVELELLKQKQTRQSESGFKGKEHLEESKKKLATLKKEKADILKTIEGKKFILNENIKTSEKILADFNESNKALGAKKAELEEASIYTSQIGTSKTVSESKKKTGKQAIAELVMGYFSSKKNSGIYGKLGDLGLIEEKYEVALYSSTPQLENIVVQTTEDAQEVVEYVRNSGIGRVSCIILDKLSSSLKQGIDKALTIPPNSKRLFDLIKVKEDRFKIAWYFAVRDTLVVDNLETATNVSYNGKQRWRVVTLGGELIDTSGTMTGGGSSVSVSRKQGTKRNTGKTSSIHTAEDLSRLESEYASCQEKTNKLKTELKSVEELISSIKNEIGDLSLSLEKIELELSSLEKSLELLKSELEESLSSVKATEETMKADAKAISKLESEISVMKGKIEDCEESMKLKKKRVEELGNVMKDIGGPEMKRRVEKIEELTETLNGLEADINKIQIDISLSEKKKLKAIESLEQFEKKCASLEESIKKTESELVSIEEVALKLMGRKKELETELESFMGEYSSFQTKSEEIEKGIEEIELKDIEIQNNINSINTKIAELEQGSLKTIQKKIQKIREEAESIPLIPENDKNNESMEVNGGKQEQNGCLDNTEADNHENGKDNEFENLVVKFLKRDVTDPEYDILLRGRSISKIKSQIDSIETQLQAICEQFSSAGGGIKASARNFRPSQEIFSQYSSQLQQHNKRSQEVEEATSARDECRKQLDSVKQNRYSDFMAGFKVIASKLKEIYQMITLGGDAELELIDSMDPFSDGIMFSVRPPKKSWRPITNLSGGEKTLSSLALVFALHQFRPSPLYFMDEVDAALDFRNVSIIATFIKEKTKNAQFIVVSLRNHMFEVADKLVGIYKTCNVTKSVSICPNDYCSEEEDNIGEASVKTSGENGELVPCT